MACPVHQGSAPIRRVSVVYAAESPRLLRPVPVLKSASHLAWAGTVCGVLGAVAIWIGSLLGALGPALIAGFACFGYGLAMYGWAGARRARLSVVERGIPRAMALWQAAWYCELCQGVFFDHGTFGQGAAIVTPRGGSADNQVITPATFHRLVWEVGGYGGPLGRLVG